MPERKSYVSGTPNWIDLQTTDQAAAKQFYGELFGWIYNDQPIDEENKVILVDAKGADDDTIKESAEACPTDAIILIDEASGEQIYP